MTAQITRDETGSAVWDLDWLRTTKVAVASKRQTWMVLGMDPRTLNRALDNGDIPSMTIGGKVVIPIEALRRMLCITA